MCIICIDLLKDNLSSSEARRNLGELHTVLSKEHIHSVLQLIWKKEDDEYAEQYHNDDTYEGTD